MRLQDLFDFERGPEAIVKLALYLFFIVVACGVAVDLICRLSGIDIFFVLLLLVLASPIAYLIRQARGHHHRRDGGRRGAERTPLLPPSEDAE